MVREVTSNSHENTYHKLQKPLPQQELPKQNLPELLQKTALQRLELELGLKLVPRKLLTPLWSHRPAHCLSEET